MRLVVLIDNTPNPTNPSLDIEHGLSLYIEWEATKILLDVGASDKFLHNAEKLHIDIKDIDYLILSHAHNDHTGGLSHFLHHNKKASIFLSSHIENKGYYSTRGGKVKDLSLDYNLVQNNKSRFKTVSETISLTPSITIIGAIPHTHTLPKANKTLFAGSSLDSFDHEIALFIHRKDKACLLSSCTHLGLLNTLESCHTPITAFVGGLHLLNSDISDLFNSDTKNLFESEQEIASLGETIKTRYPHLQIYSGHCTGTKAQQTLSTILANHWHSFYTGFELVI